jgi:hypothetical protein
MSNILCISFRRSRPAEASYISLTGSDSRSPKMARKTYEIAGNRSSMWNMTDPRRGKPVDTYVGSRFWYDMCRFAPVVESLGDSAEYITHTNYFPE